LGLLQEQLLSSYPYTAEVLVIQLQLLLQLKMELDSQV